MNGHKWGPIDGISGDDIIALVLWCLSHRRFWLMILTMIELIVSELILYRNYIWPKHAFKYCNVKRVKGLISGELISCNQKIHHGPKCSKFFANMVRKDSKTRGETFSKTMNRKSSGELA